MSTRGRTEWIAVRAECRDCRAVFTGASATVRLKRHIDRLGHRGCSDRTQRTWYGP